MRHKWAYIMGAPTVVAFAHNTCVHPWGCAMMLPRPLLTAAMVDTRVISGGTGRSDRRWIRSDVRGCVQGRELRHCARRQAKQTPSCNIGCPCHVGRPRHRHRLDHSTRGPRWLRARLLCSTRGGGWRYHGHGHGRLQLSHCLSLLLPAHAQRCLTGAILVGVRQADAFHECVTLLHSRMRKPRAKARARPRARCCSPLWRGEGCNSVWCGEGKRHGKPKRKRNPRTGTAVPVPVLFFPRLALPCMRVHQRHSLALHGWRRR